MIGGGAGAVVAAKNSSKFRTALVKGYDFMLEGFRTMLAPMKNSKVLKNLKASKIYSQLKNAPTKLKVAAAIAAPVFIALGHINNKYNYKSGQIDQKYTDKAKLEKHNKEIV